MIRNYFLVTLRTMMRNKAFSVITVFGLAIAISASFLLFQYVQFESGYDRFRDKDLYRVTIKSFNGETEVTGNAANNPGAGPSMKAELPEVLNFSRLVKTSQFTSSLTKSVVNALEFSRVVNGSLVAFNEERVYMADAPFLTMMGFQLTSGDAQSALKEPNSVVITESIAKKYFGSEQPLGKSIFLNREMNLVVTGVMPDLPEDTHLQLDMLMSYSTIARAFDGDDGWFWTAFYTYVQLAPGTDPVALEQKLVPLIKKHAPDVADYKQYHSRLGLQRLTDIHLDSKLNNEQSPVSDARTIYFLSLLAVLILFIAWINYVNLATARALERSKEVGLRKAVGASRSQLVVQFFMDAVVVNLLALAIAMMLVVAVWPLFQDLVGKNIPIAMLSSPATLVAVVAGIVSGILLIGSYPAWMLSSFNPAIVLKGKFLKSSSGSVTRKAMVSFQYLIALLLIAGTALLYRQLAFMQSQDTGYARGQIVVVEGPAVYDATTNSKVNQFKGSLLDIPGVMNMAASANVPGQPIVESSGFIREGGSWDAALGASILGSDTSFFSTYGIRLLEGRQFTEGETMRFRRGKEPELIRMVVNERFVQAMELTPQQALHEKIRFGWGPEERMAEIIGVVTNHHQESLKDAYTPIAYMQPEWTTWKYFSVRISNDKSAESLAAIEQTFRRVFPDNPFVAFRLDDYYNHQYETDQKLGQLVGIFTVLAIAITCLGLVGLTVFTVSQRTKEIGIRKVLGSSVAAILYLFSRDLVRILLIAYVVAVPLIFLGGTRWLEQFAISAGIGWQVVMLPLLLLLIVTLGVVIVFSVKKAVESPVKALKYE